MHQTCTLLHLNYTSVKLFKYVNRGFLVESYMIIHCFNNYGKLMLIFKRVYKGSSGNMIKEEIADLITMG